MGCYHRMNEKFRDLGVVRLLAQKSANALGVDMIIYKTICDGIQIFKFSQDWTGPQVEVIRFVGEDASTNILPNNENWRSITTKSGEKSGTKNLGKTL